MRVQGFNKTVSDERAFCISCFVKPVREIRKVFGLFRENENKTQQPVKLIRLSTELN